MTDEHAKTPWYELSAWTIEGASYPSGVTTSGPNLPALIRTLEIWQEGLFYDINLELVENRATRITLRNVSVSRAKEILRVLCD